MRKLLLVGGPLAIYALTVIVRLALGRRPTRHAMNVEVAILLTLYFLTTAGLGIFWVANQQLPPFDLHYLFGYATFALVLAHLAYNARIVVGYLRKARGRAAHAGTSPPSWRWLGRAAAAVAVAGAGFYLGLRSAPAPASLGAERPAPASATAPRDSVHRDLVAQYHAMSSHTRAGVVLRAPSVAWELPVDATHARAGLPRLALPEPARSIAALAGAPPPRSMRDALAATPRPGMHFGRAALATLLWATAGITERRGGLALRASASSGALFPTEIYVLAFGVPDLPPGTYAYAPEEHALVDLGRPPRADPTLGLDPAAPPTLALVATAVFRRTGQKYRDRAYRYVLADAGHVVGNALIAGAELGLGARLVRRFDDREVARAVGVDGVTEGVVALVALSTGSSGPAGGDPDGLAPATPADADDLALGATSMVHAATSLTFEPAADRPGGESGIGAALPLAAPPAAAGDVLALIASRRSARTFDRAPIARDDLAAVLLHAAGPAPIVSRATRSTW